ncbi:hypothetical protein ACFYXQ_34195 [Nocardia jiangxiensis]|uniref:Uncharacterized protein n=1 Tax=Nocardia jiangxiensis TaxID=282685 RepID=A0ABW6S998_9NOCA
MCGTEYLRAAPLLRGVPAWPRLHLAARHHFAHLRHLPGHQLGNSLPAGGILRPRERTSGAVVVDAALCRPSHPGRIHRTTVESLSSVAATSSHALGLREAITLARLLGRLPGELVVIVVEAARIDPRCRPLAVRGIGRAGGRRHRAGRTAPGPRRPALMSQLTVLERCARRRLERVAGLLSWRVPSYSCPLCVSR